MLKCSLCNAQHIPSEQLTPLCDAWPDRNWGCHRCYTRVVWIGVDEHILHVQLWAYEGVSTLAALAAIQVCWTWLPSWNMNVYTLEIKCCLRVLWFNPSQQPSTMKLLTHTTTTPRWDGEENGKKSKTCGLR